MKKVFHTRVYPETQLIGGKKVVVNYRGYFTLEQNGTRVWSSLGTPSREVAQKRILEMALKAQRVQEGMAPPDSQRVTAAKTALQLFDAYEAYLIGQGRTSKHVHNTTTRLRRMACEIGWRGVNDIQADNFEPWQSALSCSAKTKKEYQVSACAFLNWLVNTGRLATNPLAKLEKIDIRGKQVRLSRSFSEDELLKLFSVAGKYRIGYQMLLYTGRRCEEVAALVWGDLSLDAAEPCALFREGTTKDVEKCAVPLKAELAAELRAIRPANASPTDRAFKGLLASYDLFRKHLKRAGIPHKDALGRVLHRHAIRKTMQTLGVRYNVNQRAAQAILGHSDANLTANVYTDVAALGLSAEVAKLPWISPVESNAQWDAQKCGFQGPSVSLSDILGKMLGVLKAAGGEGLSHLMSLRATSGHVLKLGAGAGFEPATFRL